MIIKNYKKFIVFLLAAATLAVGGYVATLNGWFGGGAAIPSDTMTRGLVGYWSMEEGGGQTAYDGSGNSNNGTLGAAATAGADDPKWTKGKNGGGLKFDGVDDYVFKSDSTSLSITGDLTIESWINLNAISIEQTIIGKWDETTANADRSYRFWIDSSNKLNLSITTDGSTVVSHTGSTTTFVANERYHIVGIYNISGTSDAMDLYVNGVLDVAQKTTGVPASIDDNISNLYIGAKENTSGNADTFFNGAIDEPRVYNRALSAEEVRYHYNRGGPVAEWKFDEGSGAKAYDSTENNNDGTLNSFASPPTATSGWASGKYGTALAFDGTGDYISRAYDADFNFGTGSFTIDGWFKHNTIATSGDYLLSRYDTDQGFKVWMDDSGDMCFGIDDDATWDTDDSACTSGVDYDDNSWHHFSAHKNGTTGIYLYIDGILVASDTSLVDTATLTSDSASLYIGSDGPTPGNYWEGLMDQVRIYNYARAADEIRLDYNAGYAAHFGPAGKTCAQDPASCVDNGLVGYWDMDEGGASTAKDSSANGNNGTLTNGPLWTKGKKNNAIKFDGKDDYVSQSYDTDFNFGTGSFTVSGWFKHNTISAADYLATRYSTAAGTPGGWKVYMDASGDIAFAIDDDATWDTADISATSAIDYDDNKWHYFTAVKNGISSIKLYIDGVEAASDSSLAETGTLSGTTPVLYMGSDSPTAGSYWEGLMDEVRVYSRALSFEEINYLYNEKKPVGQWDFDEGAGATAHDSQGNLNITFPASSSNQPTWSKP
ncbi:MAG: LamG domain-containing protein [Minisyncoccia bacterium]